MSDKLQVLVTKAGRGGTNLVLSWFVPSKIYRQQKTLKIELFSKRLCPLIMLQSWQLKIKEFYISSTDLQNENKSRSKNCFVTRHPFDNILSKIRRGAPKSLGGDNGGEDTMPDGTLIGATKAVEYAYSILESLKQSDAFDRVKILNGRYDSATKRDSGCSSKIFK